MKRTDRGRFPSRLASAPLDPMITQRLRGLLNLHIGITALSALSLFLVYSNVIHYLPRGDLSPDVSLTPYALCVGAGMLLAGRYVFTFGTKFHRMTWVDGARIASRQTVCVALLIFTLMFAAKDRAASRIFLGSFLCWLWLLMLFFNQALPRFLSRLLFQRQHAVPTLFIGASQQVDKLRVWLATKEALGIQPVGFLTPSGAGRPLRDTIPFLGALSDLAAVIEQKMVAQVVVLQMPIDSDEQRSIVEISQDKGCRLLIYSELGEQLRHPLVPVIEEGHTFFSLQEEPLEDPLNRLVKRGFDILLSLPVVLFVLPLLCVWVWIMQRLQAPGTLFFAQQRGGQRRNEFKMLKFRSMYDAVRDAASEAVQARRGDSRIYPFGAFLRRSSLDEFPQFVNVLLGEMSIVGPRPHMPAHDADFSRFFRGYRTRHFAKPGITGLAQTRGFRGEISDPLLLQQRISNDVQYITNWSIWLDVQITVKTFWQLFFPPKTAY